VKCLVTGATGFVGSALCAGLRARGDELVAWSRSGAALADGTPTQAVELGAAFTLPPGLDSICHLAGVAHQQAPAAAYQRVNVEGSLALARAALAAGVGHFLFVSSVKAMGPPPADGSPRHEDMLQPPVDPYGASKLAAEQGLRALCRDSGMALTILRPPLVYGPDPRGNLRLLARGARRGLPRPPAGGARSMIGLDDLTRLLLDLLHRPPAGQHTWIVTDQQRYSARDIYDAFCRARGRKPRPTWLPAAGWVLACEALDRLRRRPVGTTRDKLFGSELYDSSALTRDTGWRPRQQLADVVAQMVDV
jgi:UDP-N-acetyl-alpha-D-quinovosamine dehydrogenase